MESEKLRREREFRVTFTLYRDFEADAIDFKPLTKDSVYFVSKQSFSINSLSKFTLKKKMEKTKGNFKITWKDHTTHCQWNQNVFRGWRVENDLTVEEWKTKLEVAYIKYHVLLLLLLQALSHLQA